MPRRTPAGRTISRSRSIPGGHPDFLVYVIDMTEKSNHPVWRLRAAKLSNAWPDEGLAPKEAVMFAKAVLNVDDLKAINALSAAVDLGRLEVTGKGRESLWLVPSEDPDL